MSICVVYNLIMKHEMLNGGPSYDNKVRMSNQVFVAL